MNVNRRVRVLEDLINDSETSDARPDVLLISEPPFTADGKDLFIPKHVFKTYYVLEANDLSFKSYCAIYLLNSSLTWRPVISTASPFFVEVELLSTPQKVRLASVYIPNSFNLQVNAKIMSQLINRLEEKTMRIIGGDFNSRHDDWESRGIENTNGKNLQKRLKSLNWYVLNEKGEFTRHSHGMIREPTSPDLTIAPKNISNWVYNWSTSTRIYASDHLRINFNLAIPAPVKPHNHSSPSHSKIAKWMTRAFEERNTEVNYDQFLKIHSLAVAQLKEKRPRSIKNATWQESKQINTLKSLINKVSRAIKTHTPFISLVHLPEEPETEGELRSLLTQLRKKRCLLIKEKNDKIRRLKNRRLKEKLKSSGDLEFWKSVKIKINSNGTLNFLKATEDGKILFDQKEIWSYLMNHLENKQSPHVQTISHPDKSFYDHDITHTEIDRAIKEVPSSRAIGMDGIGAKLIKTIHSTNPAILYDVLESLWFSNSVPLLLKQTRLTAIPKSPGPIKSVEELRPIGIGNHLLKVFEKIIKERLEYYANKNILVPEQVGFRNLTSIASALEPLTKFVLQASYASKVVIWKVDVENAFEKVDSHGILNMLARKIPNHLWFKIKDLLSDRVVKYTSNNPPFELGFEKTNGTSQGSALSPTLFISVMSILHKKFKKRLQNSKWSTLVQIGPYSFADDIFGAFYPRSYQVKEFYEEVDDFLAFVRRNMNSILEPWGLNLSSSKLKCCAIPYHQSYLPEEISMIHSGFAISRTIEVLGLTFGVWANSIFGRHIQMKKEELEVLIHNYRANSFHLNHNARRMIANGILIPKLSFMSEIWASHIGQAQIKIIDIIIRQIAILVIGGTYSTSHLAASVLSGIMPGFLMVQEWATLAEQKLNGVLHNGTILKLKGKVNIFKHYHPAAIPMPDFSSILYIHEDLLEQETERNLHLYTDASLSEIGGGMAIASVLTGKALIFKSHKFQSPHDLELMAIRLALLFAEELAMVDKSSLRSILVLSDAQSVIQQINNAYSNDRTILEIRNSIEYHNKWGREIRLQWIKGHEDNYGNQLVDELAKIATSKGNPIEMEIPVNYAKKRIRANLKDQWKKWYEEEVAKTTHLRKFFNQDAFPPELNLEADYYLTLMITSHAPFFLEYKKRILRSTTSTDKCPCGDGSSQDSEHAITSCTMLKKERENLYNVLNIEQGSYEGKKIEKIKKDESFYKFIRKLAPLVKQKWGKDPSQDGFQ